jgi:V8-like Glu-specific endopeptidase
MDLFDVVPADAARFPAVAFLTSDFPTGRVGGTGVLIAPRLVLTAGHVLFDPARGGQTLRVQATFGGPGGTTVAAVQVDYPREWRTPRSPLDSSLVSPVDIGVVRLTAAIDRFVTPWPFATASDGMLAGMVLSVSGYPTIPPGGFPVGTLFGTKFNVVQGGAIPDGGSQYERFRLFYPVRTLGGMSGGPVYDFDPASGTRTVRGVHTSLVPWSDGSLLGSALRVDNDIRFLILDWVRDLGGA